MSFLETEDKVLLALFGGSIALVCFFYCLAERQWAALVVLVVAFVSLALSIVGVNDDISAWDVSGVTTMRRMFREVASYDKPMNAWRVENVVDMSSMFYQASAFNQDLGWCVDDDVILTDAFLNAPCASTSCGVTQGSSCTRRNF